jgi:hypothetical protein
MKTALNKIGFTGLVVVALALAIPTPTLAETVGYGEICNGLVQPCNRYSETVLCMARTQNETVGAELCQIGLDVDLGRCQCRQNCGSDGKYTVDGEFDPVREKCVGLVGKSCQLVPDCTVNASCEPNLRLCRCNEGFAPTSDGLRCQARL